MAMPGPPELGRGVVVLPGVAPPEPWKECPRLLIERESLTDPVAALETLHRAWFERQPVVVELAIDPKALRDPEVCHRPVYDLGPRFEFSRERLQTSSGQTTMTPGADTRSGGTDARSPEAFLMTASWKPARLTSC